MHCIDKIRLKIRGTNVGQVKKVITFNSSQTKHTSWPQSDYVFDKK